MLKLRSGGRSYFFSRVDGKRRIKSKVRNWFNFVAMKMQWV